MARENSAPFRTRWRLQLAVLSTFFCAELATAKLPTFDPEFFQFSDNQISSSELFNATSGFARPFCLDLDDDGVIDCLVGNADGTVHYYHNDGNASAPAYTLNSTDFFGFDVGALASPWCGPVFDARRVDCFVGSLSGNVHYFKRAGGRQNATYAHRTTNVLPFGANVTSAGAGSPRARSRVAALGVGSAFAASVLASSATAVAVSAAGALLLQAPGAGAVNVYANPHRRRTAAAPFCGYLHPGDATMGCVCGTADGAVELFARGQPFAASAYEDETFYLKAASLFAADGADARTAADAAAFPFSTPTGLDLDGDGSLDFVVGSRNGTARAFLFVAASTETGFVGSYKQVVNSDGSVFSVFGDGIGDAAEAPSAAPSALAAAAAKPSAPPTAVPSPHPSHPPSPPPSPGPTLVAGAAPQLTAPRAFLAPHCLDLDGDGDTDCVGGLGDGRVVRWTHAGVACADVADTLGDGNACAPLPQGGFALTYQRHPSWYGVARRHHADSAWSSSDDTQLPRSRGLRVHLQSFGTGMRAFVATQYDAFTGAAETVVRPGSQTTRNVCLLARYGDAYGASAAAASAGSSSFPTLPTLRSHAVLARARDACQHYYGADEAAQDGHGNVCASTETTAIKVGVTFDATFSDGNSCQACSNQLAKCWKRVYCYMDTDASAPALEDAPADTVSSCSANDASLAWWAIALMAVGGLGLLCCCCACACALTDGEVCCSELWDWCEICAACVFAPFVCCCCWLDKDDERRRQQQQQPQPPQQPQQPQPPQPPQPIAHWFQFQQGIEQFEQQHQQRGNFEPRHRQYTTQPVQPVSRQAQLQQQMLAQQMEYDRQQSGGGSGVFGLQPMQPVVAYPVEGDEVAVAVVVGPAAPAATAAHSTMARAPTNSSFLSPAAAEAERVLQEALAQSAADAGRPPGGRGPWLTYADQQTVKRF